MDKEDQNYLIDEWDELNKSEGWEKEEPSGEGRGSAIGAVFWLIMLACLGFWFLATVLTSGPGAGAEQEREAGNKASPSAGLTPAPSVSSSPTPVVSADPEKEKSHDFDPDNCIYIKNHGFAIPIPRKWDPLNGQELDDPDHTLYLGTDEVRINDPQDAVFKMWHGSRICDDLHDIEKEIYDSWFLYEYEQLECSDFEYITICDREALAFRVRYTKDGKPVNGKIAVTEDPDQESSAYFFRLTQANDSIYDHTEDFDAILANIRDGKEFLPTAEEAYLESVYNSAVEEMNAEKIPVTQAPSVTQRPNMQNYVNPEDPRNYADPYAYADVIADAYGGDMDGYDDVWNEAYMEWERTAGQN